MNVTVIVFQLTQNDWVLGAYTTYSDFSIPYWYPSPQVPRSNAPRKTQREARAPEYSQVFSPTVLFFFGITFIQCHCMHYLQIVLQMSSILCEKCKQPGEKVQDISFFQWDELLTCRTTGCEANGKNWTRCLRCLTDKRYYHRKQCSRHERSVHSAADKEKPKKTLKKSE